MILAEQVSRYHHFVNQSGLSVIDVCYYGYVPYVHSVLFTYAYCNRAQSRACSEFGGKVT